MKNSYKKHLYLKTLSLSAAVLLAVIAQGQNVRADGLDNSDKAPTNDSPAATVTSPQSSDNAVSATTPSENTSDNKMTTSIDDSNNSQSPQTTENPVNPTTTTATTVEAPKDASNDKEVQLADSTVYMSEKNVVEDTIPEQAKQTGKITWKLDDKPIDEWRTWNMEKGTFTGDSFVTATDKVEGNDLKVSLNFDALFGEDLSLRSPNNIRKTYRNFIGKHELVGTSEDLSLTIRKNIILRPYEDFHTHDEMLAAIEKSRQEAQTGRLVQIETIGKSAQGRDVKLGIISSDQKSIDDYLNITNQNALNKPAEVLAELKNGTLKYKLPILINNTHADEQPAIDIITGLFHTFSTQNQINFKTTEADGSEKNIQLDVKQLLEKFILLFDFTENPDGDVANTRTLANGLDPNRDTGYQANQETRTVAALINKWNPIALYDIHGFIKDFLIEPATPPHDPNFEYDLLADTMVENAHHMGRAGVANSNYKKYIIPKLDWGNGWDDSFSGYTAVYAMYHGILGHTIEIPQGNQESYKAGYHAILGGIDYLAQHPEKLMEMRLNFYLRGINKTEDPKAENELVGPNNEIVGRNKNGKAKFFPDYYVIPMSLDKDVDSQQAFNMIDYFNRNGVRVQELKTDFGNYKKGDLVIDMAQPKRGYANHILYKGTNESKWAAMYAELVVNFPDMRGFKSEAVFGENLFDGKLGEVTTFRASRTSPVDTKAPYYIIANNSLDAVKAVNKAISSGQKVYLTEDGYVVETATFTNLLQNYAIYGDALYKTPKGETLKALKVYAPPHQYYWATTDTPTNSALALQEMGFEVVDSYDKADVIVLESENFDQSLLGHKPTIVVGGSAMQKLEKLGVLPGFDAEEFTDGDTYEGLMKAIVDDKDPLTSGYKNNDLFYSNSGNWIAKIPTNFKTLASIADKDFYVAGWWPGNEQLANKIVAASGVYQQQPLFIYAGNPTNRLHTIHFYRWISNAVFGSQLATLTEPTTQTEVVTDASYQAPSQKVMVENMSNTSNPTTVQLSYSSNAFSQLPQTGTKENNPIFTLTGICLALGSGYLLLKKKES